ncbi:MAG TPA: helix-turn-helix transcriptional regulator [Noviherbaspirillum sp.]|nr:helix-turn-helix transcriptional regulator [Noviherbaspirillum sp.]
MSHLLYSIKILPIGHLFIQNQLVCREFYRSVIFLESLQEIVYYFTERSFFRQQGPTMSESLPSGKKADLPVSISTVAELGSLVKAVRKAQGMTQIDVAGLGGRGNRFIVDLEKGKETVQMQKAMDVLALLGLEMVIRKKGSQ